MKLVSNNWTFSLGGWVYELSMYKGHSLSNSLSLYTSQCPGTQSRHFPVTIPCSTCDLYLGNPEHTRAPNYSCAVVSALVPSPFYAAYMSCLVSQRKAQIERLYVALYDLLYSCVYIYFVHVIFMCVCVFVCVISFLYFPYFYLKIFVIFKKQLEDIERIPRDFPQCYLFSLVDS